MAQPGATAQEQRGRAPGRLLGLRVFLLTLGFGPEGALGSACVEPALRARLPPLGSAWREPASHPPLRLLCLQRPVG